MPHIRRTGSAAPPPAAPLPPKRPTNLAVTQPVGWVAEAKATVKSLQSAVFALKPDLGAISATPLLGALGDGTATLDVPLKAGSYKVKGVSFTVAPGTVARVNVQVKNGELVPVGNGQKGTSVKIDPPLELPLWVTGRGVELKGTDAKQKFEAELGGFFDVSFKAKKLSEMVSGSRIESASTPAPVSHGGDAGLGELASQLVDLRNVKVDAKVTMRGSELDLGGAKVKIDPATTFWVKGDGQHATVAGHVQLDGFVLKEGGVEFASGARGGQAELSSSIDRINGGYQLDSKLSRLKLSVDTFTSSQPSAVVPGKVDRVSLGPTEIHDGELRLTTKLGMNGLSATGMGKPTVAMSLKASGTLQDAQLTVKDAKDSASASVRGQFSGRLAIGPDGVQFDAKLTGAHVDLRDLQQTVKGNQVSIERVVADGEVQFSNASGHLIVEGNAKNLDIVVDDFKGGAGGAKADLGRTSVTGEGKFHVGADGVRAEGRMHGAVAIDSASFNATGKSGSLGRSTVSGDVTKLELGKGAAQLRLENVTADLGVDRVSLDVGQASVRGGGRVKGTGTVVLDANGFSLEGKGQVSMQLDDGRVHSSTMNLVIGKGSGAELNINELRLGKTTSVKLGPGSHLDAVLSGGSLQVGGTTVELEKGGRAQLVVKNVELRDGKTDLRGSVKLDAKVKSGSALGQLEVQGVKVHAAEVQGRVKVSIDDVHLADDRLSFKNAQVSLDATVGHYVGLSTPGQPGLGTLQDPVAAVSAADVKKSTAAQLAGITPPAAAAGASPVEALRLLRDGDVRVEVPMQGTIQELGIDVVKLPAGSKLDLSLSVRDGKIVAHDTKVALTGGVKALGVEVLGAHLDEALRVHADLKVGGRKVSVLVPGVKLPADMDQLTTLAAKTSKGGPSKPSANNELLDLAHAQLDVSNATFSKGRIALPGGEVILAEGSKLSFHGTPLSGELTGSVSLDGVTLTRDDVALKGSGGRGELRLAYRREGDKAVVDGSLTNLAMSTDYVVRKSADGDYVSLGAGKMSGGSVSLHAALAVDARGIPQFTGLAAHSDATLNVPSFSGDLKGARMTTPRGSAALGPSHVEGAVGFSKAGGLTLKAKVDAVDAEVAGVQVRQQGKNLDVEQARLKGRSGTIELGPDRLWVDAKELAWDATLRQVDAKVPRGQLKAGQVHVSGEGRFTYDSKQDLRVEGKLHVDGNAGGEVKLAKAVVINRKTGIQVQR